MHDVHLLSHPFRLGADGSVATSVQTGDEYRAEQLAVLVLTRPGERPLVPLFGVHDPAFNGVDPAEVRLATETFGPDVTVVAVAERAVTDTLVEVRLEFT